MLDLAITNWETRGGTVSILRNNGDGTFSPRVNYDTGSLPLSVAAADLTGDGRPDLAVANPDSDTVSILENSGSGVFASRVDFLTGAKPYWVTIGEFNGDLRPDLAISNYYGNSVTVMMNLPDMPPRALFGQFRPGVNTVKVSFSEQVGSSLSASDLSVLRLVPESAPIAATSMSYNSGVATAEFYFPGSLPDGNYRATLPAGSVTDAAGNPLAADYSFDFFVFKGDINRDRVCDLSDLAILAAHYGTASNMTWADGDFNGDGAVDVSDLALLAANYGQALPAPAAPLPAEPVTSVTPIAPVTESTAASGGGSTVDATGEPVSAAPPITAEPVIVSPLAPVAALSLTATVATPAKRLVSGSAPATTFKKPTAPARPSVASDKAHTPRSVTPLILPAPKIVPSKAEKGKSKAIFAVTPPIKPVARPTVAPRRASR